MTMKNSEIGKNEWDFLYLAACGLNQMAPDADRIANMDLERIFHMARSHMMAALVYDVLEKQVPSMPHLQKLNVTWKESRDKAIRKSLLLDIQRKQIFDWFEQEKIWYMPLKGTILKEWYPRAGMREMSDNDILFDASECADVRDHMIQLGFRVKNYGKGAHDEYLKEPVYNFEMHRRLFAGHTGKQFSDYYENVKERLVKDENNRYGYHFTDEDFYIYFIAHACKHFQGSGTGVRTLADCYICMKHNKDNMDISYIEKELNRMHASQFEMTLRGLSQKIFRAPDKEIPTLSKTEKQMLVSCMRAGTYGTEENRIRNELGYLQPDGKNISKKTKIRYLFRRFVPKMDFYKENAPFVYRYKILIPFFLVYRVVRGLLLHGRKLWKELRYVTKE